MAAESGNPNEELKKLGEEIGSATAFAALKPAYFRLKDILQAFPGDFDVQFTGSELQQRLMARGSVLKQQEAAPPPPVAAPAAEPAPQSADSPDAVVPVVPAAEPLPPSVPGSDGAAPPPPIAEPLETPSAPPRPGFNWKRALVIAPVAFLLIAFVVVVVAVYHVRKSKADRAAANGAGVPLEVVTVPPGATVKVAAEPALAGGGAPATCTSNCKLAVAPGTYQVTASLDGFEPTTSAVTLTPGQPAVVSLKLTPQGQTVRMLTDLEQGKAVVDGGPPTDLQEGQLVLDKVAPGKHTVKVSAQSAGASFSFEIAAARLPAVTGSVSARNLTAVLVSSFGKQARLVTNAGPWKLTVNGQAQHDAGPAGTDLTGFQPGVNEIVVGQGEDARNMSESFGDAPMLTAFLKTDGDVGTLIVATGQDDVRVFLNDKESRLRTKRGQLRIQTVGKATVRVVKSGFQDEPAQTVEVKKGAEVRVQFDLKPHPQTGVLQIHGAMAGTEVFVDQKDAGTVGPDGSFSLSAIRPGDHTIELRHEQYLPKRVQRAIHAGEAVVLAGADVTLAAATGTVRLVRNPAPATITYRRGDEAEAHEVRGNQVELLPGSYLFTARAPGFAELTTRVQLAIGDSRRLEFTLARERPVAPAPAASGGMAEFEDAQGWKKDGESWVHKGGGFVPYKLPPEGVFTFTVQLLQGGGVFRPGQIRWCLQYLDAKNYLLYEMDRKTFWAGVVEKGKRYERVKAAHNLGNQKAFTIQVEVAADRLVQKVRVGDEWKVLDTFVEPGRDMTKGKFGFLIQGNDEIAISDFKFQPK